MSPKPTFKLTKIYFFVTISQNIFLKCCCLACFHSSLESCDLVQDNIQKTHPQICSAKLLPLTLNPSPSFSITHGFGSKRALVPILKAFTLDVRVSSLSLALCLLNYLLHAGEGHLQCCMGTVLRQGHSSSPSAAISNFAPCRQQAYQKSKTQLIVVPNSSLMLNCTTHNEVTITGRSDKLSQMYYIIHELNSSRGSQKITVH